MPVLKQRTPLLPKPPRHTIMDCTVRDGAYSVNFQFDMQTIETILAAVSSSGLEWIEVGHGLGINGNTIAESNISDREWCDLAARFLPADASWGMFAQAAVASVEDLAPLADAGMKFTRIGADMKAYELVFDYVERAKELGLTVFVNLMKSHVCDTEEAVRIGSRIENACDLDGLYFVDSVGQFLPERTAELFGTASRQLRTPLGFHGHNNLGLANANSMAAAENGASIVDCTLAGLGRDAGNAVLEQMAAALELRENKRIYNTDALAYTSEYCVSRLETLKTDRELQVLGALYGLHSKNFPAISDMAEKYSISRTTLMDAVKPLAYQQDLGRTDIEAIAKSFMETE
ncbi:beta/alpha barrel domain-containing protein [Streptomyces varsoviensis]|uniref:hypothetical protein n=1 Tax=Streptomyces varsoviensis TaxID=67373 RepID=UPI0012FEA872|nr:hypothetical protein [Streptomyces varsoviensis]